MRHFKARQLEASKRWHYTCKDDKGIYPVGYCTENCPGHGTPGEANFHYKDYLLDRAREFFGGKGWHGCEVCQVPTQGGLICDEEAHVLCDKHRSRKDLAQVLVVNEKQVS